MNKNMNTRKMGWLMLLLVTVLSLGLSSCKDSDGDGFGTPEITGVRVTDPAKADSLFTKSGAGQMVAIIGRNLSDIRHIYICDQEVGFNSTMNTANSVIVTIPSEKDGFQLPAFNSELKKQIRIVTSHGEASYDFVVTPPAPTLNRIGADYPRKVGDKLELYGTNLVDIQKIYITDKTGEELDETRNEWQDGEVPGNHVDIPTWTNIKQDHALSTKTNSYVTTSQVEVTVPEGAPDKGALVIETTAGLTYVSYYRVPGQPVITYVSNDMPQIGETLYLVGREFVQVESVKYGDVTLSKNQFRVAETQDTIFVNFQQKPSVGSDAKLTVTTPGGTVSADRFYDYSTILTTFDNDDATDNGWDPHAVSKKSKTADGRYAYMSEEQAGNSWWDMMIFYRKNWNGDTFPLSANIPDNASADELYFTMNVYDAGDYNNGAFMGNLKYEIMDLNNNTMGTYFDDVTWTDYDACVGTFNHGPVLQDIEGQYHKNQWYRAVVPLSYFECYQGKNMAQIRNITLPQFRIMAMNRHQTVGGKIDVKFDNIRVIYIPKK